MFDISQIVDQYFEFNEEPVLNYRDLIGFVSAAHEKVLTRYERKLGRKLTAHEGQVLTHEHFALDPQKSLPRFYECFLCGQWADRGKLIARHQVDCGRICPDCSIPF
jgi:hypothetical protein